MQLIHLKTTWRYLFTFAELNNNVCNKIFLRYTYSVFFCLLKVSFKLFRKKINKKMPSSRKCSLLEIVEILVKIACGREPAVRKICDFSWRSRLRVNSIDVILKKVKLILCYCKLPSLRIMSSRVLLNRHCDDELILIFGDILKSRGQSGLSCFESIMRRYSVIKRKYFINFLDLKFFIHFFYFQK